MTAELVFRLVGMILLSLAGARFGVEIASPPLSREVFVLIFGLVGALAGLILTPYLTTRPARFARRRILQTPAEVLLTSLIGLIFGLIVAALVAVPFSSMPIPFGQWVPSIIAIVAAYLGVMVFAFRAQDIFRLTRDIFRGGGALQGGSLPASEYPILLDTSVIIDGRILDISKTGFVMGTLLIPQFVLAELQHIADSGDVLRRSRGKRGLEILEAMQTEGKTPISIVDVDAEGIREVDLKLVAVARKMNAVLMTNDYNLNRVAELQGVQVLNINELANAVKAVFLPNETITIQIIAEGRESDQGVGYLEDGTMVVVEGGKRYIDRTINVVVTRMIQTAAGKMYFARPDDTSRR